MMKVGFKRFRRCGYDGAFAPRKEGEVAAVAVRKTIVKPYFSQSALADTSQAPECAGVR